MAPISGPGTEPAVVRCCQRVQLYELIYRGAWTLLCFSGVGSSAHTGALKAAVTSINRHDLQTFFVLTDGHEGKGVEDHMLFDLDEEAHRRYGVKRPLLFLVRPDGHVGLKVRPAQFEVLVRYLHRWLPDASQIFR